MQSQASTLGIISQSVNPSRKEALATATKIDNSYTQGKEILTVAKSTRQHVRDSEARQREDSERQKTIQTKLETISEIQNQNSRQVSSSLDLVHDSNINISAKIDDNFNQGETILTMTKSTHQSVTESRINERENSERLRSMERHLEQLSSVMGSPGALVQIFTQALDTHERTQQSSRVVEAGPDTHDTIDCGKNDSFKVELPTAAGMRRDRWKRVSYKPHIWNRYLSISSTTREQISDDEDLTQDLGLPKRTETTFRVMWKLPFLQRALYYTTSGTACDPLYQTNVRYTRVFTYDSAIWKACKARDLDEVRRLFISGEASPFIENESGESLAEEVITNSTLFENKITNKGVQLIDYILRSSGRGCTSLSSYVVWYILFCCYASINRSKRESSSNERRARILRLVVEHSRQDPLDDPDISSLITLDNIQDSIVTTLTQQLFWPLNLMARADSEGRVVENSRHMLDDPNGAYLRELFQHAKYYRVRTDEGKLRGFDGLFEIAMHTTRADLRQCCKIRMKLIISTPKFHRLPENETLDFDDVIHTSSYRSSDFYDYYLGRSAIRRGYRPLLEEIFRELGWNDFKINDFFDKETFYCVPGLLDGEIIYETSQQMRQGLILSLCEGALVGMSKDEIESLAIQILYTVKVYLRWRDLVATIEAANIAFISKSTPGSWPEEGNIRLVPGVDFVVHKFCEKEIFTWYRDYVDPNFEFELSD